MSGPADQMYREEISSQEPMKSVLENNPEIYFVPPVEAKTGVIGNLGPVHTTIQPAARSTPIGGLRTYRGPLKILSS
ncbi:MAG: hypothetical protein ACJ0Q3_03805 [Candidatus Azotimanducaceae bacterium]